MKPFTANSGAFLPQGAAFAAFEKLQSELLDAWLGCIDKWESFSVECDPSDFAIATCDHPQSERQVGCIYVSTLSKSECNYLTAEKEDTSIIEAARKWSIFWTEGHSHLQRINSD